MPDFVGSIALIRRFENEQTRWLVQHHECSNICRLIQAERLEEESFRECIDREVSWALSLERNKDYIISSVPRLHLEVQLRAPGKEEGDKIVVEFYVVDLYGRKAAGKLDQENLYWVTGAELKLGVTGDGRAIDPLQQKLLAKAEVIPVWSE